MTRTLAIVGGSVISDGQLADGVVVIREGLIVGVGPAASTAIPPDADRLDASGLLVAPGLIDIQINGGFGHDFTDEPSSMWEVGARLTQFGVTAFLPTIISSPRRARDVARAAVGRSAPDGYRGAMPLGLHLEGPFLNPSASGAHDPSLLRVPADADPDVHDWSPANGVRMVTLAPELPGALELITALATRGVLVSAGHSAATYDQAIAGIHAGIMYATHLFNAMPVLDKREPGLVGAVLDDDRAVAGLIVDGVHLHRATVRLVAALLERSHVLSLVTDATAALGMPAGRYTLGSRTVVLDGRTVRVADDGRLAGSALSADAALRNLREASGWSAVDVIGTMTSVPAGLLGLADRGQIAVSRRADLALLTPDLEVVATFVGGQPVHGPWE